MITIVTGTEQNTILFKTKQLISPLAFSDCQMENFSGNLSELFDKINQSSLFDKKVLIVKECSFLEKDPNKFLEKIRDVEKKIILLVETKKIISTSLAEIVIAKAFNKIEKQKLLNNLLEKHNVSFESSSAKEKFIDCCYADPFFLENEVEKLINIASYEKISEEMVNNCVFSYENENIFKLINFFLTNKKLECIQLFEELINKKYQPVELIQFFSTQIFNLWIYQKALSQHLTSSKIEQDMKISKFQQTLNNALIRPQKNIAQLINEIYILDYNIKHGNINPYIGLKTFLLK